MSILRRIVTAGGGLVATLMVAPILSVQAQVVAPGTNPQSPTANPAPTANPTQTTPAKTGDTELRNDLPFLREAASANLMEVTIGRLPQSKASDTRVKDFGERMVSDHSALQQQLTTMTSSNGVGFTPTLDAKQQQEVSQLQRLTGSEFDREYITTMVQHHQNDVSKFEDESRNADSPRVRELAAKALPTLQYHLSLSQRVAGLIGVQVATTTPPRSKVPMPTQPGQVSNQPAPTAAQSADVRADRKFIHEVAADHLLEMDLAQLADRKGESPAVKQFAERVKSDHERMQNDWVAMASSNGYEFKPGYGKNHRKKLTKLEKLSGRAFDQAYLTTVVQDRKDYINYFEKEGRAAHSAPVRQLVERDLPTLRSHFTQGKRIGGPIGADTAATLRSERLSSRN
jgi:putative membrane protein